MSFLAGAGSQTHTYTGYSLDPLLNSSAVGIATDPAVKGDILGKYVVTTGSDGYKAVFSMGELNPAYGGSPTSFIALSETINGIETPLAADGFARIVAPGDGRGSLLRLEPHQHRSIHCRAGTGARDLGDDGRRPVRARAGRPATPPGFSVERGLPGRGARANARRRVVSTAHRADHAMPLPPIGRQRVVALRDSGSKPRGTWPAG